MKQIPLSQDKVALVDDDVYEAIGHLKWFAELQKMGVIQTLGTRPCRLTGQKCIEWDVTDHVPESKPVAIPKLKLKDEAPAILGLLEKLDKYFSNLPEELKQEVLHYEVNQLKDHLQ